MYWNSENTKNYMFLICNGNCLYDIENIDIKVKSEDVVQLAFGKFFNL